MRKKALILGLLFVFGAVLFFPKSALAEAKCYVRKSSGSYEKMPSCNLAVLSLSGFNTDGMPSSLDSGCYYWSEDASKSGKQVGCSMPAITAADAAAIFGAVASAATNPASGVVTGGIGVGANPAAGAVIAGASTGTPAGNAAGAATAGLDPANTADAGGDTGGADQNANNANNKPVDPGYNNSGKYPCGAPATNGQESQQVFLSIDIGCEGKGNPILDALFAIIRFLSMGVGIVVVGSIVVAGIQYTTSRGDPQATAKALERITNSLIALTLFIFAYALLNWLIPAGLLK
jgi:hypothetical protein